uniref:Uncharacterized protein n=1 Tax=Timema tahoe TaxID=61484 RepID=A0A7R9II29_9NEOP|nr:unnamed protein product [Timema tahoe]
MTPGQGSRRGQVLVLSPVFRCALVHDLCAGHEVVIVKNGMRVCGSGGALASAPLVQSKSYFEVKLQQSG